MIYEVPCMSRKPTKHQRPTLEKDTSLMQDESNPDPLGRLVFESRWVQLWNL